VAHQLEDLRQRAGKSTSAAEKAQIQQRIGQLESFAAEMKDFEPALPTITFDKTYVIKEKGYDLHLEFHGLAHTAGDIVVFCPQKRVIASGDAIHPGFPAFIDAYPQPWPKTIDSVAKLPFEHSLPGHGRAQHDRKDMTGQRDYIEELTERVIAGKKTGQSAADLQRTITVASLKSLQVPGYSIAATPEAMERGVRNNVDDMYDRVEKVAFTGSEPLRMKE
jgi:glyoxylase-like metal-dependent hydrolase (beta-lactamase superfamily II)